MTTLPKVGIGVLIFNREGEILVGQRLRDHGASSYGPPGGHLEFGESFESCAIREVAEETGLIIESPQFLALTNDVFIEEEKHYISIFMKATYPEGQPVINLEPHKILEWKWFDFNNLPENIFLPLKNLQNGYCYHAQQKVKIPS